MHFLKKYKISWYFKKRFYNGNNSIGEKGHRNK